MSEAKKVMILMVQAMRLDWDLQTLSDFRQGGEKIKRILKKSRARLERRQKALEQMRDEPRKS
jgi:hypothetical protein